MAVKYRNIMLLLGIIIVLVAAAILSTKRGVTKEFVTGDDLRRILIERPRDTTEILVGDQKISVNPGEYPGDTVAINRLIAQVKMAKVGEVISGREELYGDFAVDDSALKVTLGGKRSRSFYIGKQAADFMHTYVRFVGDDRVYLAQGISRMMFDRNPDEWRDRHILAFDMGAVNVLIVGDKEFRRRDSQWFLREREVDLLKMTEILNLLSNLRASGFAEDALLFEPVMTVSIVSDAFTHGIEVGNRHEQFFYLLRVSGRRPVYLINEYIVNLIKELSAGLSSRPDA